RTLHAADPKGVANWIAEVQKEHGSIDVLHYNAASMRKATLSEQPRDSFNGDLAVNIGAALVAIQAGAPKMEEQKSGAILLTGGGFALAPSPDYLSISIGKAGIREMAQGLFDPVREKGIHGPTVTVCTLVSPESKEALSVAEQLWQLYTQSTESWTAERNYTPASAQSAKRVVDGRREFTPCECMIGKQAQLLQRNSGNQSCRHRMLGSSRS